METLDKYKIDLKGMQSDACTYGFLLDDQFFTLIDAPEIQKGRVYVSLNVKRLSQAFELNFQTEGTVTVLCDRCLDEMQQPIHSLDNLIVKFGDGYAEEDDNLIIVPESVGIINVAWYMYEFIVALMPLAPFDILPDMEHSMPSALSLCQNSPELSMPCSFSQEEKFFFNLG